MVSATVEKAADHAFFDGTPIPLLGGSTKFSLQNWVATRDSGIAPSSHSGYSDNDENRLDFLTGARLMGYELEPWDPDRRLRELTDPQFAAAERTRRRDAGYFDQIVPQQLQMVDTLGAGFDLYAVEVPRRGSKTTTIFCLLLGRCARNPGYEVTFSAQTGVKGSARLREWKTRLDQVNPPPDNIYRPRTRPAPQTYALFGGDSMAAAAPKDRGFRVLTGAVGAGIYFDNASKFLVLKPEAEAYRGEAADTSWLDEAQEIDPDEGDDLLAGLLPLQDTKIGSSTIVSGTAGEARVGPFWSTLDKLRRKDPDVGGIDFAAPDTTPWEDIEDFDTAMALITAAHPGIGTLTTIDKMRKNWAKINKPKWAREYLSMWPESFGVRAIDALLWAKRALSRKKPIPARVAFAMAIKPRGSTAAIVAAWRDAKGIGYIEVVAHQSGTSWMPEKGQTFTTKYRGSTIGYDTISTEANATVTEMSRMRPKPRTRKQTWPEIAAGCVQFMRDLESGKVRHFDQVGLNDAAEAAVRREVRGENGQWLWGADANADITCLIAATNALANWDKYFARAATAGTSTPIMGD